MSEALENVKNALVAVIALYEDPGRSLPQSAWLPAAEEPLWCETVASAP